MKFHKLESTHIPSGWLTPLSNGELVDPCYMGKTIWRGEYGPTAPLLSGPKIPITPLSFKEETWEKFIQPDLSKFKEELVTLMNIGIEKDQQWYQDHGLNQKLLDLGDCGAREGQDLSFREQNRSIELYLGSANAAFDFIRKGENLFYDSMEKRLSSYLANYTIKIENNTKIIPKIYSRTLAESGGGLINQLLFRNFPIALSNLIIERRKAKL